MTNEVLPVQVDYTSRDFASLREDLVSRVQARIPEWSATDPSDFGVALVEAFAYMGDLMSYYIDRAANESSLSTARRRANVIALARDLGYDPAGYSPATVELNFINSSANPILVPERTVVSASVSVNDLYLTIPFETDEELTIASNATASVMATQGRTVLGELGYGEALGLSSGAARQVFELPDASVLRESVQVYVYDGVNYLPWQRVEHLYDYAPLSRVYQVRDTGSDVTYIEFGDGVSGMIPSSGYAVYAEYRVVDGVYGNVPAGAIRDILEIPGVTQSELAVLVGSLSVSNDTTASGGTDPEDTESIRFNARQAYRTSMRAVTLDDYQNIALSIPSCGKASAQSQTPGSVVLAVSPYRNIGVAEERPGFDYTESTSTWSESIEQTGLKEAVTELIESASLVGTTLTVINPTYSPVEMTIQVQVIDSLRQVDALRVIQQAILEQFDYARMPFGASIAQSDVISLVSSLGVAKEVAVSSLKRVSDSSSSSTITADPDEIFTVAQVNLTIELTGGA